MSSSITTTTANASTKVAQAMRRFQQRQLAAPATTKAMVSTDAKKSVAELVDFFGGGKIYARRPSSPSSCASQASTSDSDSERDRDDGEDDSDDQDGQEDTEDKFGDGSSSNNSSSSAITTTIDSSAEVTDDTTTDSIQERAPPGEEDIDIAIVLARIGARAHTSTSVSAGAATSGTSSGPTDNDAAVSSATAVGATETVMDEDQRGEDHSRAGPTIDEKRCQSNVAAALEGEEEAQCEDLKEDQETTVRGQDHDQDQDETQYEDQGQDRDEDQDGVGEQAQAQVGAQQQHEQEHAQPATVASQIDFDLQDEDDATSDQEDDRTQAPRSEKARLPQRDHGLAAVAAAVEAEDDTPIGQEEAAVVDFGFSVARASRSPPSHPSSINNVCMYLCL